MLIMKCVCCATARVVYVFMYVRSIWSSKLCLFLYIKKCLHRNRSEHGHRGPGTGKTHTGPGPRAAQHWRLQLKYRPGPARVLGPRPGPWARARVGPPCVGHVRMYFQVIVYCTYIFFISGLYVFVDELWTSVCRQFETVTYKYTRKYNIKYSYIFEFHFLLPLFAIWKPFAPPSPLLGFCGSTCGSTDAQDGLLGLGHQDGEFPISSPWIRRSPTKERRRWKSFHAQNIALGI